MSRLHFKDTKKLGMIRAKSNLPGLASRTPVELLGKPSDSTSVLKALPGYYFNIKKHSLYSLYICLFQE